MRRALYTPSKYKVAPAPLSATPSQRFQPPPPSSRVKLFILYILGKFQTKLGLSLLIGLILLVGYSALVSRIFNVNNFSVQGAVISNPAEIQGLAEARLDNPRFLFFKESSLLFYSSAGLRAAIEKKFPVQDVNIQKKFPHSIQISIKEISEMFTADIITNLAETSTSTALTVENVDTIGSTPQIIATTSSRYLISTQGTVIKKVEQGEDFSAYTLARVEAHQKGEREDSHGAQVVDPVLTQSIYDLQSLWKERIQLPVAMYIIDDMRPGEITARVGEGWQAYFSTQYPLKDQVHTLEIVLAEKFKDSGTRRALTYVDLKIPGKVYWK